MGVTREEKIINILNTAEEIRNKNENALTVKLAEIKSGYISCVAGCAIGLTIGIIWGISGGGIAIAVYGILCAAIGGSFKNFIDRFISALPGCIVHTGNLVASLIIGIIKVIIYFVVCAVMSLFDTIKNICDTAIIIKRIHRVIEEDNKTVNLIKDYLDYYRCMCEDKSDLNKLILDGERLHENSFAKLVIENDEDYALCQLKKKLKILEDNQDVVKRIKKYLKL